MANPERDVIADIDALEAEWAEADAVIDHNLRANRGFDDYHREWHDRSGDVKCPVCMEEWHGLQRKTCPGAYATEEEKRVYFARHPSRTHIDVASRASAHTSGEWRITSRRVRQQRHRELQSMVTTDAVHHLDGNPANNDPDNLRIVGVDPSGSALDQTWSQPVLASPQMQSALVEHIRRWPEDQDQLMRRFRSLIFTPDGRPVPWTDGGLRTVLGGNATYIDWARRQLGFVDLGAVDEDGVQ